jgi:hypothetical protein
MPEKSRPQIVKNIYAFQFLLFNKLKTPHRTPNMADVRNEDVPLTPTSLPDTFPGLPWYKRLTVVDIVKVRLDATTHVRAKLQEACEKNDDTVRHKLNLDTPTENELLFEFRKGHRDFTFGTVILLALSTFCWVALYSLFGQPPVFGESALTTFLLKEPSELAMLLAVGGNGLAVFAVVASAIWLLFCLPPFEAGDPRPFLVKRINRTASQTWYVGDKAIYVFSPEIDSVKTVFFDALGATSHSGVDLRRRIGINDRTGNGVLRGTVSFRYDGEPALDFIDARIAAALGHGVLNKQAA